MSEEKRRSKGPRAALRIGLGKIDNEFQYSGTDELLKVEENLISYNKSLINRVVTICALNISPYSDLTGQSSFPNPKKNYSVLDFGAGIGTFSSLFYEETGNKPDCLEIDNELSKHIQARGFQCFNNLSDINKKYDLIFTFNVLEHILDDEDALMKINNYLKPGGILIVYVPALQLLYSNLDKSLGHYRRYSKKDLETKVVNANFHIGKCHYNDSLGFFVGIIFKLLNYKIDECSIKESSYKFYDTILYPISRMFDFFGLKYCFGKNLFLFAKKKQNQVGLPEDGL